MVHQDEVTAFIRATFRSVWSLEVMLLLRREARSIVPQEIVSILRASDGVVAQSLDTLIAAGLVATDEKGAAFYCPAPLLDPLAEAAAVYYARSPDAVRRIIVSASAGGLAAFADAFRLRRD
ncbi:MAG: hypothetical protein E6G94_03375 [Alphaproteobacteria bacterium]|nr:MAG: hypothetical protein E6G94_03375 [Alphaproteobacteria bacterium]